MRNRKSIKIRFQQKQKAAAAAVIFAVNKTSRKAISDMNKSLSLSLPLTFSFFPFLLHTRSLLNCAHRQRLFVFFFVVFVVIQ